MMGETEWYLWSVQPALVDTKEEGGSHKIYDIAQDPKLCELETDRIMVGIRYVFAEQAMTEQLIATIYIWNVEVKVMMESTKRNSIIMPE